MFARSQHEDAYNFDINLGCTIVPHDGAAKQVCATNFKHMYWTMKQQLVHHTISGCNVRTGDLMGSGTISGPVSASTCMWGSTNVCCAQ